MKFMCKLFFGSLLLLTVPFSTYAAEKVLTLDRIIAVVDSDAITRSELDDRMAVLLQQFSKQGAQLPPREVLEKQVLERMINDRLQLQQAEQTGLRVDDNQLDKTLERIAEQNKVTLVEFRAKLGEEGISFQNFREDIRREIIIARLREREVERRVNVTEAEIDNLLTTQSSAQAESDEYDIAHILVRTPEEASPETLQKLRAKAEDIYKKLQGGADFPQTAAAVSDAPNALEGGRIGWKKPTELPELFQAALKPLKTGELSEILRSSNGFHILKMADRRGLSTPLMITQSHTRHILIRASVELARQYSEDGSANKGGDLGWSSPGDMVPEFEKVMDELKLNQVSEPIKSRFGWHLIEVLERRVQDMSKESARLKARQEIRGRKADEFYQDWVRELRDRAYVEYRLEDKD
jgi:peptidyl-prolyl cis-trans isomerase SurA